MQLKKKIRYKKEVFNKFLGLGFMKIFFTVLLIAFVTACDDFVDVDLPKNQLTAQAVFEDASTATSALRSIYSDMRNSGIVSGLSRQMGLYADELDLFNLQSAMYDHTVLATNGGPGWWSSTYNTIYAANSVVEGVENSTILSIEDTNQLKGEALFIRAFLHTLLVQVYGPVPYIKTTDYTINTTVSRMSVDEVYSHIITDLLEAEELLSDDISGERVRAYDKVAESLLARVYLYTGQWELAEEKAGNVISNFVLEPDLNAVFLKNSPETIWQFKPILDGVNTDDGTQFILSNNIGLSTSITGAFEANDQRAISWVGGTIGGYYPFKYKEATSTSTSVEYPIIFRLAEQYLIRAEARAQQEEITEAQSDLNIIRNRAGLPNTTATSKEDLLDAILNECLVELFTEHGHRWFDLVRTGKAAEVIGAIKLGWKDTDVLLPIPESEILLNPNLLPQNDGY